MVQKRQLRQGGEEGSRLPNKRQHFASSLLKGLNSGRNVQESVAFMEPMLRKMVQESVDQALARFYRPSYNQVECPVPRSLQLQFHSNVAEILFTGNRLLSEDRSPIKVVLYDSASRQIMSWGHLSSIKVTIVVLDGDFVPDDREDWMKHEFENKLVKNREGRRPLVAGEATVTLKDGVGYIGELSFTDNSKWSRTGKFRLGAKALPNCDDISIREAVSNAFRVKDHRGESYQKHYPPMMDDEVWRLEKIAKDGTSHKKLNDSGILTVRDFLRLCARDQSGLRAILGVSRKTWDTILRHANTTNLGDERSICINPGGVLFFDPIHRLNTPNSHMTGDWIPVSDPPVAGRPMLMGNGEDETFTNPNLDLSGISFQQEDQGGIGAYHSEVEQENSAYHLGESSHLPQGFNPAFRNSFAISDPLTFHNWGCESNYVGSHFTTDALPVDDAFHGESSSPPWKGNEMFLDPGIGIISSEPSLLIPRSGTPKTRWCKVLAVVKWRILVRRNVAARRCKRFYNYM